MWDIFTWLVPLALVDSLNPVTLAVQLVLLGGKNPVRQTAGFLAGISITYFAGGVVLLELLSKLRSLVAQFPETLKLVVISGVGASLITTGVYIGFRAFKGKGAVGLGSPLVAPGYWATFIAGVIVTATDVPTAVPYLATIDRLNQSELGLLGRLAWLLVYDAIYIGPLLVLLVVFLVFGDVARNTMLAVHRIVVRWSEPVLAVFCLVAGVFVVVSALR
jgi:cytochrome c biogenesis protein CcdA